MTKVKIRILILVLAGTAALLVFQNHIRTTVREKDEALTNQTERIAQLEAENEQLSNAVAHAAKPASPASDRSPELLRLRGEVGVLRRETNEMNGLRTENTRLLQAVAESQTNQVSPQDLLTIRQTQAVDAMTTLLQAIKNYATNHHGQLPTSLDHLLASGELGTNKLAGNFGLTDFELGAGQTILRLRVPIAKPGGGGLMVVGGITDAGVPHTSVWNVSP